MNKFLVGQLCQPDFGLSYHCSFYLVCDKLPNGSNALIHRRLNVDTIKSNSDLKQLEQFQYERYQTLLEK